MELRITISAETLRAYARTAYAVAWDRGPFILRPGERSDPIVELHRSANVVSSAYITACNPFGLRRSDDENAKLMERLCTSLSERGIQWIPGEGRGEDESWSAEPSVLALGVSVEDAKTLCVEFEQNAVLVIGDDAIPRLVFHPRAVLPVITE
jgi:hypothetical protein